MKSTTAPLLVGATHQRSTSFLRHQILLFCSLGALCVLLLFSQQTSEIPEEKVSGKNWHFWSEIKKSPFFKVETCSGDTCMLNHGWTRHVCGNAQTVAKDIVENKSKEKHCAGYAQNSPANAGESFAWATAEGSATVTQVESKFVDDFRTIVAAHASNNLLFQISVDPDHVFLIEYDDGAFRIYQAWVNAFDLEYWTSADKQICEDDGGELSAIASAKSSYGGLKELSLDDIIPLLQAVAATIEVEAGGQEAIPQKSGYYCVSRQECCTCREIKWTVRQSC